MSKEDISDKYLDPAQNPMILVPEKEMKTPAPLLPEETLAPMIDLADVTAEGLSEKLAAAFPAQDEALVGNTTFIKMVDGSWTEKKSGKALEELPLADLLMLNEFLQSRQKS
jgi:hypothetical protein